MVPTSLTILSPQGQRCLPSCRHIIFQNARSSGHPWRLHAILENRDSNRIGTVDRLQGLTDTISDYLRTSRGSQMWNPRESVVVAECVRLYVRQRRFTEARWQWVLADKELI